MREADWLETASATNATATATHPAEANGRHTLTGVWASYGAAFTGLLTITYGGKTLTHYVVNSAFLPLGDVGLRGNPNGAIVASLPAGGAGVVGTVTIVGVTV